MRLGIFGDIHFQKKGLNRIIQTGQWIVEEFKRRGVQRVICLGDLLNTRETVDVEAQAAAFSFLSELIKNWHVHVVLGNHDMNLKHSRRISSLEALTLSPNVTLHREMGIFPVGEQWWLMLPYHEDQSVLVEKVQQLQKQKFEIAEETIAFGHLSLNGAVQITRYNTKFAGAVGPDVFAGLKRTFTGHFHVHQEMDHRVMYVGSPQQFNFGDAGDTRGIVIYDPEIDQTQFVVNPLCDVFLFLTPDEISQAEADPGSYEDTFVTLIYDDVVTEGDHDKNVERLEAIGVISVKKESVVERAIREHAVEIEAVQNASIADLIPLFVNSVLAEDSVLDDSALIRVGQAVVQKVNDQHQDVADTGAIFHADPVEIEVEDFMGFQKIHRYPLQHMDGIWFSEGANGSGKSTLTEAMVWVYFGKQIRSNTKVDDVINDVVKRGCRVKLTLANGYAIERWRKYRGEVGGLSGTGIRVIVNGQVDPDIDKADPNAQQRLIDDLIGINYETYTKSNVLGQNVATNFVGTDEKKRRTIIEQMLGLERVDECLAMIRDWKSQLSKETDQQASIQTIKANELSRQTEQIAATEYQILTAQTQHDERINTLTQRIYDGGRELVEVETRLQRHEASKAQVLQEKDVEVQQAEARVDGLRANLQLREKATEAREGASKKQSVVAGIQHILGSRDSSLQSLRGTMAEAEASLTLSLTELAKLQQVDIEAARALLVRIQEIVDQAGKFQTHQGLVQQSIVKFEDEIRVIQEEQVAYQKAQQTASQSENCPKCGQGLDHQAIATILKDLQEALSEKGRHATSEREKDSRDGDHIKTLEGQVQQLRAGSVNEERLGQIQAEITQKDSDIAHLRGVVATEDTRRDEIEQQALTGATTLFPEDNGILTIEMMIQTAQDDADSFTRKADHLDSQFDGQAWDSAVETAREVRQERATLEQQWDQQAVQVRSRITELSSDLSAARGRLEQTKADNPVDALNQAQQRNRKLRDQISDELERCKTTSIDIEKKQGYVKFWDSAFAAKGAFRGFLLSESVKDLNRVLEGYTSGLDSLPVTFNSDLTVQENYGKRSGGQRKCTDLSVLFAMFEIVSQRSRHKSSIMLLDELFESLDAEHHRSVMEVLTVLAQRVQKIIVITHRDITGCTMAGSLFTEMTDDGSKVTITRV